MFEYGVESDDFQTIAIRVRATGENLKEAIVEAVNEAANSAALSLHANAPHRQGSLMASIEVSPAQYVPGAVGGGGFYEARVSIGERAEHARYVIEGSGIYGPSGQMIKPSSGNVMYFEKQGEKVFTKDTTGQRAQTDFITFSQIDADMKLREALARIDMMDF